MITRTIVPTGPAAILAIAAGLWTPASVRAVDPNCAIQAEDDIAVGPASRIAGDVAATGTGGRVRLSHGVEVADGTVVLGDSVRLGPGTSVDDVEANALKTIRDATIRGSRGPATLPVLEPACSILAIECGGPAIDVQKRRTQDLAPGRYGSVTVHTGGTLVLGPGRYEFCDLTVGRRAALDVAAGAGTSIGIFGPLRVSVAARVEATGGSGVPIVDVGGPVRLSSRSRVGALLSAPGASLAVGPGSDLTGRFCAADVHVSNRTTLACPPDRPTTTTTVPPPTTSTSTTISSSTTTSVPTTSTSTTTSTPSTTSTTSSSSSTTTSTSTSSTSTSTSSTVASTSTSTSTTSTTSTSISPLCGNGALDPGETCDDGNDDDNDSCPADCVLDACTPVVGGTVITALLSFESPGVPIAGFEILLDYPEGKLDYQSAQPLVAGFSPPQDHGHALFLLRASSSGVPSGTNLLRTRYAACMGAPAPTNGDFGCQVLLAVDAGTNAVEGVTCSVALE